MKASLVGVAAVALATLAMPGIVAAQQSAAEVKTWAGTSFQVSDPSLHSFYSVLIEKDQAGTAPTGEGVAAGTPLEMRGSIKALSTVFEPKLQSRWAVRPTESITMRKDGVETRVPVDTIQELRFGRKPVMRNALPPYHASADFRRAVTVVLKDGSRIESDDVSFGTMVLTGATPQGRVDIPWQEIEVVRFNR